MVELPDAIDINEYLQDTVEEILSMRAGILERHEIRELAEMFQHHALMKGKALRPSLCMLVCDAFSGDRDEALNYGVGVEFLHSATLVHDDIVDREYIRRGVTSIHQQFGIGKGILFGDVVAALAYDVVLRRGLARGALAGSKFSKAIFLISRGALIEHTDIMFTEEGYLDMLRLKTAVLYGLSSELGCVASNQMPELESEAVKYGESVGMAFQLMDDVVDVLKSVKQGKPVGDVTEGKLSMPMIYLYNTDESLRPLIKKYANQRYIGQSSEAGSITREEVMSLLLKVNQSDAIDYTNDRITDYIVESKNALARFPNNKYTATLFDFAEFACGALKKEIQKV